MIDIFEISGILETEQSPEFLDWVSLEGSERINELSRQLRSFLNFKCEIIRMRFSKSSLLESNSKVFISTINPLRELETDLAAKFSQYTKFLKNIGVVDGNIVEMIKKLKDNVRTKSCEIDRNAIIQIRNLSKEIWIILHKLSELETHQHPRLLNVIIQIAGILCSSESLFFSPFSDFYLELKENYSQLEGEFTNLMNAKDGFKSKKTQKVIITE